MILHKSLNVFPISDEFAQHDYARTIRLNLRASYHFIGNNASSLQCQSSFFFFLFSCFELLTRIFLSFLWLLYKRRFWSWNYIWRLPCSETNFQFYSSVGNVGWQRSKNLAQSICVSGTAIFNSVVYPNNAVETIYTRHDLLCFRCQSQQRVTRSDSQWKLWRMYRRSKLNIYIYVFFWHKAPNK